MADDAQPLRHASVNSGDSAEDRLALLQRLQTSQEPSVLVQHLFQTLAPRLSLSGLVYRPPHRTAELTLGQPGRHQCDYRLDGPGESLGQLLISRNRRFSEDEQLRIERWLALLVGPLTNALRYQKALQMALQDSLTGLGNRAALDSALNRELRLADRYHTDFSLLLVDVDHFKRLNDRWGHSRGDQVLKQVARVIAGSVRESDLVYRYGGEEFVVLLSRTDYQGAAVIAERVRRNVAGELLGRESLDVTVSVGISSRRPEGEPCIHTLFDRADHALYHAKDQGRNRVVRERPVAL